MQTYRVETTVAANRMLTIHGVPFSPGEEVEVIILNHPRQAKKRRRYSLRGKPVRYTRPFDGVAEND